MNLAKAKELNKESEKSLRKGKFTDHADAIKLSNEAVQWMLLCRVTSPGTVPTLLNGETEK